MTAVPADRGNIFGDIWEAFERGALIVQCAWCRSVQVGEDWVVAPPAVFSAIDSRLSLTHSICPACVRLPEYKAKEQT